MGFELGLLSSSSDETDGVVGDGFGFLVGSEMGDCVVTIVEVELGVEMGFELGLLS